MADLVNDGKATLEIRTLGARKGTLTLRNANNVESIIDFSGDKITYKGDLKVSEAAALFFDALKSVLDSKG